MEKEKTIHNLQQHLAKSNPKITQGPELGNDISYKWVA